MIIYKRIYEDYNEDDGYRILVDRLWPRGISKERARLDYWAKEIAPSESLRKRFNHEKDKFEVFKENYLEELKENKDGEAFVKLVKDKLKFSNLTLLYAAKNEKLNQAIILKEWLENQIRK